MTKRARSIYRWTGSAWDQQHFEGGEHGWEVAAPVGKGGQGAVHRARQSDFHPDRPLQNLHRELGRAADAPHARPLRQALAEALYVCNAPFDHVLKEYVPRDDLPDGREVDRSKRELNVLERIKHPNLIEFVDSGLLPNGHRATVYPHYTNGDLAVNQERYKGDALAALRAGREILSAVVALHKEGVYHRDIKPSNVFVDDRGSMVLGDLGLVYVVEDDEQLTRTGESVGNSKFTPDWGLLRVDYQRTFGIDLYAIAKVIWCLASGLPRLRREDFLRPLFNLEELFPDAPGMASINQVLERAVVGDPRDLGYSSGTEMLEQVGSLIEELKCSKAWSGGDPSQCIACVKGRYKRVEFTPLDFEKWAKSITAASYLGKNPEGSSVRVYRCSACGQMSVFCK